MIKRLSLLMILSIALLVAGCDSTDAVATVNARKAGTATAEATLTEIAASTLTRTPTRTPTPGPPSTPTTEATEAATTEGTASATEAATESVATPAPTTAATLVATTVAPTSEATRAANENVQTTVKSDARVRSGPSLGRPVIGQLAANSPITVVGRQQNWFAIRFEGAPDGVGWLFRDQISAADTELASLPVITPAVVILPSPTPVPVVELDKNVAWFAQSTMYLLFVRSFRDSNGDGIGDLQGVIDGLDYLQNLGVKTIWLLPVFQSPSYHGYDTIDYYKVNPDYGTNGDLIRLIKTVHQRKMYILLDYVFNHSSDQHPFFKDAYGNLKSEYSDFYRWMDDAHTRAEGFAGSSSMPRFNYDNPKMRRYAIDVALYWMDPNKDGDFSDGADGYRCDVAGAIPRVFWAQLRTEMNKKNPRAVLLGEIWDQATTIVNYSQGDGLNATFDFPTWSIVTDSDAQMTGRGVAAGTSDPGALRTIMLSMARRIGPQNVVVRFSNNHDTNRIMSVVNGDIDRARAAAVWLLTAPGVPMIYYGEEIGMKGVKGKGTPYWDEYRREPLDWYTSETGTEMTSWFKPNVRNNHPDDGISVEEETKNADSMLSLYRTLGKLRAESPALYGQTYELPNVPGLYIAQRWSDQELYVVIINFTKNAQTLQKLSGYLEIGGLKFDQKSLTAIANQQIADISGDSVTLRAVGYLVLRARR